MSKKQESEWMNGEEVIAHIMRVNKCSRQEAELEMLRAIVSGRIPAYVRAPHIPDDKKN